MEAHEIRTAVNWLEASDVCKALEDFGIVINGTDTINDLRDALAANIIDGTIDVSALED